MTAVLRFVAFFKVDLFSDPTFLVVDTMTWTCVEPGVYLIAATLPSLRPLFHTVIRDMDLGIINDCLRRGVRSKSFWTREISHDIPLSVKDSRATFSMGSGGRDGFTKLSEIYIIDRGERDGGESG